jgi:hypothetical protein
VLIAPDPHELGLFGERLCQQNQIASATASYLIGANRTSHSLKKPDQKLVVRANLFGAAAPSRNAGTEGAPTAGTVGINQSGNADPIATRTCELLGNTEIGRKRLCFFFLSSGMTGRNQTQPGSRRKRATVVLTRHVGRCRDNASRSIKGSKASPSTRQLSISCSPWSGAVFGPASVRSQGERGACESNSVLYQCLESNTKCND